ncbi:hypothetical protein BJ170DRAFT_285391 [Xylariales sp. AK1849]|nr:hypothetical protein BJ170DRAFT_285391 [Xylariales sp. AK1849]
MDSIHPIPLDSDLHALLLSCSPETIDRSWSSPYGFQDDDFGYDGSAVALGHLGADDMILDGPNIEFHVGNAIGPSRRPSHPKPSSPASGQKTGEKKRFLDLVGMQTKFSIGRNTYVASPAADVWESHKSQLQRLYLDEEKTLREIISIMQQRGFKASAKMYKTRFKQWGFVKNNSRQDISKMLQVRRQRAAVGKHTTFKRNGKTVKIDEYLRKNGIVLCELGGSATSKDLPNAVRYHTPPPSRPAYLRSPGQYDLKELLLSSLKDLPPSFSSIIRPCDGRRSSTTAELWDIPRYLKLACLLFSESRHSQAGSICRSAFNSIHTLVYPPRLDTLFHFLFSQLWWANRDVTLELWRYLGAYMSNVLGVHNDIYHLFRAIAEHIETRGYESYLDCMADCIDDILRINDNAPIWGKNQMVGWCQLIVMDTYFTNGFNPRADRIQARCAEALPRSRLFPRDRRLNEQIWREKFARNSSALSEVSRHEKFLRLVFVGYAKLLGSSNGAPVLYPRVSHIEGTVLNLSRKDLDPSAVLKHNRSYSVESSIIKFMTRDIKTGFP